MEQDSGIFAPKVEILEIAMSHGGRRPGAGKKKGTKNASTRAKEAAVRAHHQLTAQATVEQIRRGMMFDVRRLYDRKGNLKPIHRLSEEEATMIASFEVVKRNLTTGDGETDRILKVKVIDRQKYVELAAKYHGLLKDVLHLEGDWEKSVARLTKARGRAAEYDAKSNA